MHRTRTIEILIATGLLLFGFFCGRYKNDQDSRIEFKNTVITQIPTTHGVEATADAHAVSAIGSSLGHEGLPNLRDKLLKAGVDPALVSVLLFTAVRYKYEPQKVDLIWPSDRTYWSSRRTPAEQQKIKDEIRAQEKQMRAEFDALTIGLPHEEQESTRRARIDSFGSIPIEKVEQLKALQADRDALLQQTFNMSNAADREASARLIDAEFTKDAQQLLTPNEYRDFELRQTQTAKYLKGALSGTNISEQQYGSLFDVHQSLGKDLFFAEKTETNRRKAELTKIEIHEQAAKILPAEDLSVYLKNTGDGNFISIQSVVSASGGSSDATLKAWFFLNSVQKQWQSDAAAHVVFSPEQSVQKRDDTFRTLQSIVGAKTAAQIYAHPATIWLNGIYSGNPRKK